LTTKKTPKKAKKTKTAKRRKKKIDKKKRVLTGPHPITQGPEQFLEGNWHLTLARFTQNRPFLL
jgi:hypothetical protein